MRVPRDSSFNNPDLPFIREVMENGAQNNRKRERETREWRTERRETGQCGGEKGGADDGMRGWASGSRATTVHNHVMRLSCQLRKYLSQFVACNGLALSSTHGFTRPPPDRRPITSNLLLLAVCHPLWISLPVPLILSPSLHVVIVLHPLRHVCIEDNSTMSPNISTHWPRHPLYKRSTGNRETLVRWHSHAPGTWERIDHAAR